MAAKRNGLWVTIKVRPTDLVQVLSDAGFYLKVPTPVFLGSVAPDRKRWSRGANAILRLRRALNKAMEASR